MKGYVYLFHSEGTNYYKIGKTAENPRKRMGNLQSGNPFTLRMIDTVLVDDMDEKESAMHEQFKPYRRIGEWFEFKDIDPVLVALHGGEKHSEYREVVAALWGIDESVSGIRDEIEELRNMLDISIGKLIESIDYLKEPISDGPFIFDDDDESVITDDQEPIKVVDFSRGRVSEGGNWVI